MARNTVSSPICWQGSWLFLGAAPWPASVGWPQVQRLLQVLFLAAWTLDRSDSWRPASLHQLRPLLLTMPLPLCLLGGAVGKGLCKVNGLCNFPVYSHWSKSLFKIDGWKLSMHYIVENTLPYIIGNILRKYWDFHIMCLLQASWFIWEALGRTGVGGPGGFDWWPCRALQFGRLWFRGGAESTTGQWPGQEKVAGPATSAPSEKPVCTQLLHKRQSWRLWNIFLHASVFLFSFLFCLYHIWWPVWLLQVLVSLVSTMHWLSWSGWMWTECRGTKYSCSGSETHGEDAVGEGSG